MLRGNSIVKVCASVVIGVSASASLQAAEGPGRPPLVFNSGFETGDLSNWGISGNAPQVQGSIVREGGRAIKSVVNRYDTTAKTNYRTEVVPRGIDIVPGVEDDVWTGVDMWYGFSIYLPAGHIADRGFEAVMQLHDVPDPGESSRNPIFAIWSDKGRWAISNLWDNKAITPYTLNSNGGKSFDYGGKWSYELGPYETGKWTDWVIRVRWSWGYDGVLQVWKNGVLVVDQQNKPNCFNDQKMPYFKMGIYKGWVNDVGAATKREVYHDSFRMAVGPTVTYKDVAPGGSTVKMPAAPTSLKVQ